jgi:hypothetical protein
MTTFVINMKFHKIDISSIYFVLPRAKYLC